MTPVTETDRKRRRIAALTAPFLVLAVFGAFVPLVVMVRMSVSESNFALQGFQLRSYEVLFTSIIAFVPGISIGGDVNPVYGLAVWNSIWFASVATVLSVSFGVAVAYVVEKYYLPRARCTLPRPSFPDTLP